MRKFSAVIIISIVLMMAIGLAGCDSSYDAMKGVWQFDSMYINGDMVSDETGRQYIVIEDDKKWVYIDDISRKHEAGTFDEKDGKLIMKYDNTDIELSLEDDSLVWEYTYTEGEGIEIDDDGSYNIDLIPGTCEVKVEFKRID